MFSPKCLIAILVLMLASIIPILQPSQYILHLLILMGIYALYSSSWNLLAYTGQASLGHSAFLGLGGYTSSLLIIKFGVDPWLSLLTGGASAAAVGFLIGLTCVRLREWFLAMVTFGFAVIAETAVMALDWVTQGATGYATNALLDSRVQYYYTILVLASVTIAIIYLVVQSKIGLAFSAIRENQLEAEGMGINTVKYKLLAFVLSSFFTGVAGGFLVHYIGYISNEIFSFHHSFMPLIISVTGGLNTITGPIIGSIIILSIWEALKIINPIQRMIAIGVFLTLVVIFMPRGLHYVALKVLRSLKM
ncbi:branched-chain amino acid ABC transporter permease [Candidatus Bathyarchaeota archaeon]|nr:branched-chain amino acid ABC transporter permease [Candidatus Bathyarchaeota archaeon]